MQRQKANREKRPRMPLPFHICEGCSQGAENQLTVKSGEDMSGNPKPGDGNKKIDCTLYRDCLDLAAKKNWKNFNCEGCNRQDGRPQQAKTEKSPIDVHTALTIEFRDHPEVILKIRKLAKKRGCSVESQVRIMLMVFLMREDPNYRNKIKRRLKERKESPII